MISNAGAVILAMSVLVLGPPRDDQRKPTDVTVPADQIKVVRAATDLGYPLAARAAGVEGVVVVRAELDAAGVVVSAHAVAGHPLLTPDSLSNIRRWTFRPNPQRAIVFVYDFRIDEGRCHDPTRSVAMQWHDNLMSIVACTEAKH